MAISRAASASIERIGARVGCTPVDDRDGESERAPSFTSSSALRGSAETLMRLDQSDWDDGPPMLVLRSMRSDTSPYPCRFASRTSLSRRHGDRRPHPPQNCLA